MLQRTDRPSKTRQGKPVVTVAYQTLPMRATDAIRHEMRILQTNPYTCRKVGTNPLERELAIPFGGSGYVALFEIVSEHEVAVSAIRHQREDDYH